MEVPKACSLKFLHVGSAIERGAKGPSDPFLEFLFLRLLQEIITQKSNNIELLTMKCFKELGHDIRQKHAPMSWHCVYLNIPSVSNLIPRLSNLP